MFYLDPVVHFSDVASRSGRRDMFSGYIVVWESNIYYQNVQYVFAFDTMYHMNSNPILRNLLNL